METYILNNEVIRNHGLFKLCPSTLNEVSERDYPHKNYFNKILIQCLDMDTYEKNVLRRSNPDATVDAVIGISGNENNHESNARLLLVELRIGYKNANNLEQKNILSKVKHTKDILLEYSSNVEKKSIFVFSDKECKRAEYLFYRFSNENKEFKKFEACGVSSFNENVILKDESEYVYKHDKDHIEKELSDVLQKKDWESYLEKINLLIVESFKFQNDRKEFDLLKQIIQASWNMFLKQNTISEVDEGKLFLDAYNIKENIEAIFHIKF